MQMIAGNIEFKNCDFHWSTRIETLEWPAETENFDSYFASLNDDDTKHVTYYLNGCTFDGGIEANKELLESAAWVADGMTGIAWFHDPTSRTLHKCWGYYHEPNSLWWEHYWFS